VFVSVGGDKRLARQKWYSHWGNLKRGIGIEDYQTRKLTWYFLRHFGVNSSISEKKLLSGIPQFVGTSVYHIEIQYGHYDDDILGQVSVKNFTAGSHGISYRDRCIR
jgi:hypothetical protein